MARYPNAHWRPVQGLANDPPITPIGVILHVSGSEATSLHGWFDGPSGGIESHLHIARDGTVEQYRDTQREADANYKGNSWMEGGKRLGFLSVETQGVAAGEWTPEQLTEIRRFLAWASRTHGFPLRVAPSYRSPGVGWHVMWGAGEGTDSWSNARGKVCPGRDRIRQFHTDLIPWMARPVTPASNPGSTTQEDDMTVDEFKAALKNDKELRQLVGAAVLESDTYGGKTLQEVLVAGANAAQAVQRKLGA
jgi:hypothetical protein